ncbi:MAG TPA: hypothetical protein DCZ13_02005 [Porticoccaceae bacterium]|nr:hypothetical protein [Porticoccaceae bacterium]
MLMVLAVTPVMYLGAAHGITAATSLTTQVTATQYDAFVSARLSAHVKPITDNPLAYSSKTIHESHKQMNI